MTIYETLHDKAENYRIATRQANAIKPEPRRDEKINIITFLDPLAGTLTIHSGNREITLTVNAAMNLFIILKELFFCTAPEPGGSGHAARPGGTPKSPI
jgi:hypothetical protein